MPMAMIVDPNGYVNRFIPLRIAELLRVFGWNPKQPRFQRFEAQRVGLCFPCESISAGHKPVTASNLDLDCLLPMLHDVDQKTIRIFRNEPLHAPHGPPRIVRNANHRPNFPRRRAFS